MTGLRPRLLFLAPVMPASTGNGLAMRGWSFLEAYGRGHDIHLVVVELFGHVPVSGEVRRLCRRVELVAPARPPWRLSPARAALPSPCRRLPRRGAAAIATGPGPWDAVHVQRLYMTPVLDDLAGWRDAPLVLDLDEIDSLSFARLAELHARRGEPWRAWSHRRDARRFARLEQTAIPRMSIVSVCSPADAARLSARFPAARVEIIANAPPAVPDPPPRGERDIDLLFVGTFTYAPNRDGAEWLVRDIRPLLPPATRIWLVGPCSPAFQSRMNAIPGVTATNRVARVEPLYARAKTCVVPLRAGAGTRIKILEAFALGVPVVSTTVGAEGLAVTPGEHLLLADSPADFAAACRAPHGAERARAAQDMLRRNSSRDSVLDAITRMVVRI